MERKIYPLKSNAAMGQLLEAHYRSAHQAKAEGKKIAWCLGQVDTSIAVAMGYIPVYPENHACICGSRGVSTELCQIAEGHEFSPDLCSYARNDLGTVFDEGAKSPVGGLPRPDLLLSATMCNTHLKWWEELARLYQVPLFVQETPFLHDGLTPEDLRGILNYVRSQLEEEITFLEGLTGNRLDWGRLQETVALTRKAGALYGDVLAYARRRPSPVTSFDTFLHLGPLMIYRGFPQAVDFYQLLKAEVEERVAQGVSAVGEELYRLYWDNIPIWFRLGYLGRKFAEYGACLVAAVYPFAWTDAFARLDPEEPIDSIARAQEFIFLNRGTDYRIELLCRIVSDYAIDGLVMQMSRTCKPYIVDQFVITRETEKRTGVPSVIIEGDMVDSRLFSQAETDGRIEAFMELLAKRKKG